MLSLRGVVVCLLVVLVVCYCCAWFVVCGLWFVVCCVRFGVRSLSLFFIVACCLVFWCLMCVVRCLLSFVVCHSLCDGCCLCFVVRYSLCVACRCLLFVISLLYGCCCALLYVVCYVLFIVAVRCLVAVVCCLLFGV